MTRQVVDELGESLRALRSGVSHAPISVSGPERLLRRLRERVCSFGVDVEYVEEAGVEIRIEARETLIESRLGPWADLLAAIAG